VAKKIDLSQQLPTGLRIHPDIRDCMIDGELVVWTGRAKGVRLDTFNVAVSIILGSSLFYALRLLLFTVDWVYQSPPLIALGFAAFFSFFAVLSLVYIIFAPSFEVIALTNYRVVIAHTFFSPLHRHAGRAGDPLPPITEIRVTGTPRRGRIKLRGLRLFVAPPIVLTGVSKPLELAALIKSTLALDLPIQDRTRGR
jgi:hypothetical protein